MSKTSFPTGNLSHEELEAEVDRLWHREAFFDASQKLAQLGYCEWDYDNGRIIRSIMASRSLLRRQPETGPARLLRMGLR
jgi:hypothetical protein